MLKIEMHGNVARLLFKRIVTSLFIYYKVEYWICDYSVFQTVSILTREMCRFAYSFTATCHDHCFMFFHNDWESFSGNLQEISEGFSTGIFLSTMEILFCNVVLCGFFHPRAHFINNFTQTDREQRLTQLHWYLAIRKIPSNKINLTK